MTRLLKWIVNSDKRQYYIKINEILSWLIIWYAKRYPEPTHENVVHPNTHILIDIRDEFFERWNLNSFSKWLCESLFRMVIVKYEHSPNWRNLLDWTLMKLQQSNWKPFNPNRQMPLWRKL